MKQAIYIIDIALEQFTLIKHKVSFLCVLIILSSIFFFLFPFIHMVSESTIVTSSSVKKFFYYREFSPSHLQHPNLIYFKLGDEKFLI